MSDYVSDLKATLTPIPKGSVKCPPCKGKGKAWGNGPGKCPLCHGEGILPDTRNHLPECHYCEGSGRKDRVLFELCPECGGWAHRERKPVAVDMLALTNSLGVRPYAPMPPDQQAAIDSVLKLPDKASTPKSAIIQIEAGKPRTAHLEIAKLFNSLKGEVRVCDPYYGTGSLLRLDDLKSCQSVRFLTHTPDNKEKSFIARAIQEFVTEHPHVTFRKHTGNDLHDRFVVTTDELILLGHGLKDIGNKESFVVRLDRNYAGDMIDTITSSFDQKWQNSQPLP